MRVVDLDRDMRDVIPTGTSRDSEFLFQRMTDLTLDADGGAGPGSPHPGRRQRPGTGREGRWRGAGGWVVGPSPRPG